MFTLNLEYKNTLWLSILCDECNIMLHACLTTTLQRPARALHLDVGAANERTDGMDIYIVIFSFFKRIITE
jgi:hypothetical protein